MSPFITAQKMRSGAIHDKRSKRNKKEVILSKHSNFERLT